MDGDCIGQPIAFCLVRREDVDHIATFLEFALEEGISPLAIVVDKDRAEINAIKQVFPAADILLCHFHCLKAADAWINKLSLTADQKSTCIQVRKTNSYKCH